MSEVIDDKAQYVLPFILERLHAHQERHMGEKNPPLFIIGMNGVQGAGKTTMVTILAKTLRSPPYSLPTTVLSVDDLYLPHERQKYLAALHASNPLVQHRGQPSTHDLRLALSVFSSLRDVQETKIPQYDKSKFNGQGDRVDESEWEIVNDDLHRKIRVLIFEGWCVGFRPLGEDRVRVKWEKARAQMTDSKYRGRLGYNRLEDVVLIDEALKQYNALTDQFDAMIHIDAEDPLYVYDWRLDQEIALRAAKGSGMTDEEVHKFVDGYYPAYELYTDVLRAGIFGPDSGRQLRLIIDKNRKVKDVIRL